MRGKVENTVEKHTDHRITPAYAGKSYAPAFSFPILEDHPRVCGEKTVFRTNGPTTEGSPPRMRGKVIKQVLEMLDKRITPAYAGKRTTGKESKKRTRDHPRVCGEKKAFANEIEMELGSPPRMRGKGFVTLTYDNEHRITPAYAGKSMKT